MDILLCKSRQVKLASCIILIIAFILCTISVVVQYKIVTGEVFFTANLLELSIYWMQPLFFWALGAAITALNGTLGILYLPSLSKRKAIAFLTGILLLSAVLISLRYSLYFVFQVLTNDLLQKYGMLHGLILAFCGSFTTLACLSLVGSYINNN